MFVIQLLTEINSRKLFDISLLLQRKLWRRKRIHIYSSISSGLMMEEFHKRNMDSAENTLDSFIHLMPWCYDLSLITILYCQRNFSSLIAEKYELYTDS